MTDWVKDLADDSLVIRGGMKRGHDALRPDVEDAEDQGYGPVLSVFVGAFHAEESMVDALSRLCEEADIPHRKVQVTDLGTIRRSDFPIDPYTEGGWPDSHCHISFRSPIEDDELDAFSELFGEPQANPTGGKRTR